MKTEQIFEVALNGPGKKRLELWTLTRKGKVWVPLAFIEITESMAECYRNPLMLKFGCLEHTDQLKEQLSESLLLTPQA